MRPLQLAIALSALALTACHREAASDETASNDLSVNDVAVTDNETGNSMEAVSTGIDAAFVTEAMEGDNGEVAIGNLAATQASSAAAKAFGQALATDHGGHKHKLQALASKAGVPITEEPSSEAKSNLEKLKALHGSEFDREFARMMVEDHEKDIAKYEKQASTGDPESSAMAKETLPTLRKHLAAAKSL
jgi:putative membrane protein